MAIFFQTQNPQALLNAFHAAVTLPAHHAGAITTWEPVHQDGVTYYTHRAQQWNRKAFLKPAVELQNGRLAFYVLDSQAGTLTRLVYSYYCGHAIETVMRHFPGNFVVAQGTPNPFGQDSALRAAA